jgi:hypothetical protein
MIPSAFKIEPYKRTVAEKLPSFKQDHRVQTGSGHHSASRLMTSGGYLREQSGRGVSLAIHLHLAPMLIRMRGAIPPRPYVFMSWYLVKHSDNFTFTSIF